MWQLLQFPTETTTIPFSSDEIGFAIGGFIVFALLISLLGLAFQAVLGWLVYRDAEKRGDENALIWGLLVFFLSLLGLVIYIVFIMMDKDKKARQQRYPQEGYQSYQGTPQQPSFNPDKAQQGHALYCKNCGSPLPPDGQFCQSCGTKI